MIFKYSKKIPLIFRNEDTNSDDPLKLMMTFHQVRTMTNMVTGHILPLDRASINGNFCANPMFSGKLKLTLHVLCKLLYLEFMKEFPG